jgi:subtilase family serine protease
MVMKALFTISVISLLLLSSSLAVNGAFAINSSPQTDAHLDEINGPGGLMSLAGPPIQSINTNNPLEIKEHHPAHVKKFIGHSVSLSGGDAPASIWTAYGFNKLSCTHITTTDWTDPNLCGHGQTIAIVDAYDDPNVANDLQTFDTQFGLPACTVANGCFAKDTQGTPSTDSGWALEISLDVQWAHSIAPGAKIVLVESSDSTLGNLLSGVDTAVGTGAQQVSNSWGGNEFSTESSYDYHFNSATASFFVASGDGGHGVEWPAASPYVISVGGTTLVTDSSGNWLSETAWSGSGGGFSNYEPKPSYQNNFNSNSNRAVPDVAYDGDPNTGVYVYDSTPINGNSGWWVVGGTSAGAPQWAAISAMTNSQNAKLASASFGTSNALYGAAAGTAYATNYHDITSGSNGNCGAVCNAGTGYDEVTGLGSPQSNNLVSYISPNTNPDFTISSNPSSITINAGGGSGGSTITISSINGFSGTINLAVSPSPLTATLSTSSVSVSSSSPGSATLTISAATNAGGIYPVLVNGTSGTLKHSTTVTVTVPTVPSAPQNLVATAGNAQVALKWNAPSSNGGAAITGYNVYRGATTGGEGTTAIANLSGSTTSYTDTGLTNGNTYYYTVKAVNSVGTSSASNEASATPQKTPILSVSVTTDKSTYPQRSTAHITVTVTNSTPVSGVSVTLTVTSPSGSTSHGTGTTNSNGQVTFSYSISRFAHLGTYTASATATKSGYLSGSGSTTFSVT